MCQYISIVLPGTADIPGIKLLLAKYGFGFQPFRNDFVLRQLKEGRQLVNTTPVHCDCDSVIGCEASQGGEDATSKDIERLRGKGWSQTKINNWLASKTRTDSKAQQRSQERQRWIDFLTAATRHPKVGVTGLYSHWYSESLTHEKLTFNNKVRIPLSDLKPATLDHVARDVLYEFVA